MRNPSEDHQNQRRLSRGSNSTLPSTGSTADLNEEEVHKFLDLIERHNPKTLSKEDMVKSVNSLYEDWSTWCSVRGTTPKPKGSLMAEFGKIHHGRYGRTAQQRAMGIIEAGEQLSPESIKAIQDSEKKAKLQGSASEASYRRSQERSETTSRARHASSTDVKERSGSPRTRNDVPQGSHQNSPGNQIGDENLEEERDRFKRSGSGTKRKGKIESGHSSNDRATQRRKGNPTEGQSEDCASGVGGGLVQVGRNGLAVLPPGLFDILRAHLKDEILGSAMPLIRNEVADQTRDIAMQNQNLLNRVRELEEEVRIQNQWLQQLMSSKDRNEWGSTPFGRDPELNKYHTSNRPPPIPHSFHAQNLARASTGAGPVGIPSRGTARAGASQMMESSHSSPTLLDRERRESQSHMHSLSQPHPSPPSSFHPLSHESEPHHRPYQQLHHASELNHRYSSNRLGDKILRRPSMDSNWIRSPKDKKF
ncbi:hypothetical protein IE53DRAFT_96217 [Violaceomyces palustris]|uniref:Uncharacterized protein n=1 Tax=Violaceomyces palustris TaxID=1673888 RepID=A0ACD0P6Y6_9BASI|nr:hypothetical protein IE53DRAFT_96217 [Violaceomyces palustris]